MTFSRRAALTAVGAATLASCGRGALSSHKGRPLDAKALSDGFPAIAARARPGAFAVGVMDLQTTTTWYWNIDRAFPLQSVFKAPMAAAALGEVDAGRLSLTERVAFRDLDLSPPISAINQKWPTPPDGYDASIPVSTLFTLALQLSDNTAADVLMKRIGGPGAVTAWLELKQINELRVDRYEREIGVEMAGMPTFRPDWKDQAAFDAARNLIPAPDRQAAMDVYLTDPRDSATLPGALNFLYRLAGGDLLSAGSTAQMLHWMEGAVAGANRFRAGLPKDVRFAHKPGSSPTDLGFTPATNDVGIATWPDGRRFAMAGFLAGSTATEPQRDQLFADAARLITAAVA